jgi:RNA polymerase primary sigma factor
MGEASQIRRVTVDEEVQLSRQLIAGRNKMHRGVARMGATGLNALKLDDERLFELARERAKLWPSADKSTVATHIASIEEAQAQALQQLCLEDDTYKELLFELKPEMKLVRSAAMRGSGVVRRGPHTADLEKRLGNDLNVWLSGYKLLAEGSAEVENAVAQLTKANLRLVLWMAKKYRSRSFYLDMVQEGNLGLIRAARKFDHRKGARFGSYAGWWIRQAVEGYLSRHSRTIRIPVNTLNVVRRVRRVTLELGDKLRRPPTQNEIAKVLGLADRKVRQAQRIGHELERGCVALDGPIDDDSGSTLNDVLADSEAVAPLETISARQMATEARRLLETLDQMESAVLRRRFGIGAFERHTLQQIGNEFGLTKERIRQIEIKALGKLRFRAKRLGVRP